MTGTSPVFILSLPNNNSATIYAHGGTYAVSNEDREKIESYEPQYTVTGGDNFAQSYVVQKGRSYGVNIIAGVGGVSQQKKGKDDLFRTTTIQGPAIMNPIQNSPSAIFTYGSRAEDNSPNLATIRNSTDGVKHSADALNSLTRGINNNIAGILANNPANVITSINVNINPSQISDATLDAINVFKNQLQASYPNATINFNETNNEGTGSQLIGRNISVQFIDPNITVPTISRVSPGGAVTPEPNDINE